MTLRNGRRAPGWLLGLVALTALAGCGQARPDATAAGTTAEEFYRAVAAAEGAAACALLAPSTVESLEEDAGEACDEAVLEGEVGDTLTTRAAGAAEPTTRAAGRQAQVTLTTDVLFLTISGDHWLVTAAGCDARPDRPYDCVLEGS